MRKRNPIVKKALAELEAAGIAPEVWHGGKHIRLAWIYKGKKRTFTCPLSPGDYRSEKNNQAQLRRMLREDGIAA